MEKSLKKGEIIGKNIKILKSKNKSNNGMKGKIIDETKNMLKIKTKNGEIKMLIKSNITFKMEGSDSEIHGEEIQLSPEERIKIR